MKAFQVSILAAERPFYVGPCESLVFPGMDGQYGIWADHRPMITAILPGEMTWRVPGGENQLAIVSYGLIKVADNEVLVLADTIERPEEIEINRARRAADEAKEAQLQKKSIQEYRLAQTALHRAMQSMGDKKKYI